MIKLKSIIQEDNDYNKDMIKLSSELNNIASQIKKFEGKLDKLDKFQRAKKLEGPSQEYARQMFSLGRNEYANLDDAQAQLEYARYYLESVSVYWKEYGSGVHPNDIKQSKFS